MRIEIGAQGEQGLQLEAHVGDAVLDFSLAVVQRQRTEVVVGDRLQAVLAEPEAFHGDLRRE
ncbi:hypothetical protein D3C79_1033220 [compost metagenome]